MTGRSIWAVVAGVLFIIVVTTIVDVLLHLAGVYGPMEQPLDDTRALIATSYRIVISVAGGWLTARLAPQRPMKHAIILGVVGVVLGLIGAAVTWNRNMGPHWYGLALVVLAIPQCWAGAKIFEARSVASRS
jgi:peptidoglycan/LPS O-acetylase OafA/YrhL